MEWTQFNLTQITLPLETSHLVIGQGKKGPWGTPRPVMKIIQGRLHEIGNLPRRCYTNFTHGSYFFKDFYIFSFQRIVHRDCKNCDPRLSLQCEGNKEKLLNGIIFFHLAVHFRIPADNIWKIGLKSSLSLQVRSFFPIWMKMKPRTFYYLSRASNRMDAKESAFTPVTENVIFFLRLPACVDN